VFAAAGTTKSKIPSREGQTCKTSIKGRAERVNETAKERSHPGKGKDIQIDAGDYECKISCFRTVVKGALRLKNTRGERKATAKEEGGERKTGNRRWERRTLLKVKVWRDPHKP